MSGKRKSSQKGQPPKRVNTDSAQDGSETLDIGVIEKVSLKNFMCHSQITMSFSSNVNFIVGKNGSGKSAIITAVVVGLGGKIGSTSRGSLKSLIKEGSSSASIEITLRNRGKEAYKKHLYGEKIIVVRRIFADGMTYYRIKNDDGNVVTNTKEDLVQILEQFNIQVDNPLTCLNQEMSKHFLHSKNETDKYKFFMKSTQLEQMSNDYAFVKEHRITMQETLNRKEKLLPDLEKEVLVKEQKFRDQSTLHELKGKINGLRGEMAWSHVIQLEHLLIPLKRHVEKEQKRTPKYTQMVEISKQHEEEAMSIFEHSQNSEKELMEKAKNIDSLCSNAKSVCDRIRTSHRQLENTVKTRIKQRQDAFSDMQKLQKRINDLMESINNNRVDEKKRREKSLEKLQSELETLKAKLKNIGEQMRQFENAKTVCVDIVQERRKDGQRVAEDKQKNTQLLKSLMSDRKNRLQLFGVKMPWFVQRIEEEWQKKRFHQKPRGPIGACISLKDPTMAVPVETAIQTHISAFVVDDHHDMKVLSQLRSSVFTPEEATQITIYTTKFSKQVYDVSHGKVVHDQYNCVLDLLNIEDPVIANCLIDMGSVETILVIPNLNDAMKVMQNSGRPPARCTQAYTGEGDEVYEDRFYSNTREPVSRFLKADVDDEIRRRKREIQEFDASLKEIDIEVRSKMKESHGLEKEIDSLMQTKREIVGFLKDVQVKIRHLEGVEDVSPPDVKDLLDEVNNYEQQLQSLDKLIQQEGERLKTSTESLSNATLEWKKHDDEMRKLKDSLDESRENMGKVENDVEKAKADLEYYEDCLKKHLNTVQEMTNKQSSELNILEKEREDATILWPDRVNTRRTRSDIENQIRQIERLVAQDEEQDGQRKEFIKDFYAVKEKYNTIKKGMKFVRTFIKAVDSYLKQRQQAFIQMRIYTSLRCRMTFDALLKQRGFIGKMHFSHSERLLQIAVQPGDAGITTDDMRALSGGERSFSTVCFILSLWEEIESPFCCLDEFDVFMDMANRRVAMEMMLETAMNDKFKQFIFLTPHDISTLPQSSQIKVWRMADPERERNQNSGATNST